VQSAREAARRAQCVNNLKQIGLALANYESTNTSYPLAYQQRGIDTVNISDSGWGCWSPQALLFPYIEAGTIANSMNFSVAAASNLDGGVQATAATARINSFLCPSSHLPTGGYGYDVPGVRDQFPGNNYFASVGPSLTPWTSANPRGIFGIASNGSPSSRSIADISDGTSNTIAFGEWRMGDFDINKFTLSDSVNLMKSTSGGMGGWNDSNSSMPNASANAGMTGFQTFLQECAGAAPTSTGNWKTNKSHVGSSWIQGMLGYALGTTLLPPNSQYPNCQLIPWGGDFDGPGMNNLGSFHPGGANVAMTDGSVRFLKSTTSMQIIWAIGSRAGGEVVSSDAF
jgi:prepilin-type processing-associated H-X9-DG protein